jgi:hypothetical protein
MGTSFFTFKLRTPRDFLMVRQRARQIAGLLGYEAGDQTFIAAAVFEIARAAFQHSGRCAICFEVDHDTLNVFPLCASAPVAKVPPRQPQPRQEDGGVVVHRKEVVKGARRLINRLLSESGSGTLMRLQKDLPKKGLSLARPDLSWAVEQLEQLTPLNLLEEIQYQNQELLRLFHELQSCRAELAQSQAGLDRPVAA